MPNTPKEIFAGTPATSNTSYYTVPPLTTTIITDVTLSNTTGSDATITVAKGAKNFISGITLGKNETMNISMKMVVPTGVSITALQGTSSAINLFINGYEVT